MDALQGAVPVPQHEVMVCRALGRQVLRQRLPLTAGGQHVQNRVQDLTDIHIAGSSTAPGRRYHRRDQGPLSIRQIARVTLTMTLRRLAVFGLPHRALLCESSATTESQLIHPTQLLLGSALRRLRTTYGKPPATFARVSRLKSSW